MTHPGFADRSYITGTISRTTRFIGIGLGRRFRDLDLTFAQYLVLVRLWRAAPSPLAQRDLALDLAIERSSMSTLLVSLERSGLVERHVDANDGRRLLVELTDKGQLLERPVLEAVDVYEAQLLAALGPDALEPLQRALSHLHDAALALRDRSGEMRGHD